MNKIKAFTMAELLIAMTIIAVLTVLIIPTIHDKISKKQWELHKKALYSRMVQAMAMMPKVTGYGEYTVTKDENDSDVVTDTAAMAFLTEGLSKHLAMNNICGNTTAELKKCGLPENIHTILTVKTIPFPKKLSDLNPAFATSYDNYSPVNSGMAAFETINGDSVAVYYNPYCQAYNGKSQTGRAQNNLCANFIYDLNGLKGPNEVGKDIGAFSLVMRDGFELWNMPEPKYFNGYVRYNSIDTCNAQNLRATNIDEVHAAFYNYKLIGSPTTTVSVSMYSSSLSYSNGSNKYYLVLNFETGARGITNFMGGALCVKR